MTGAVLKAQGTPSSPTGTMDAIRPICPSPGPGFHLGNVEVNIEALPVTFHLPDPDFASQLARASAESLQREGAVQVRLQPTPKVIERNLL